MNPDALVSPEERPFFLVVEGTSGVGKSTLVSRLAVRLHATAFHFPPEWRRFRDENRMDERMTPLTRLGYYLAGVVHLSELVREALSTRAVICDRYLPSVIGLMVAEGVFSEDEVLAHARPFERKLVRPDLTILLVGDHETVAERLRGREVREGLSLSVNSRRTVDDAGYFVANRDSVARHARALGQTVMIDTSARSPSEVEARAADLIQAYREESCARSTVG